MKGTIITIATIAAAAIGFIVADEINVKGKSTLKKKVWDDVTNSRSEEDKKLVDDLNDCLVKQQNLKQKETEEALEEITKFKESISYDKQKKEIDELVQKKVDDYKVSIGYEALKDQYKKEYDNSLEEWKKDNNYISRIQAEKDKVAEANKVASNQKLFTSMIPGDSEFAKESNEKIKEAIKEAEDKAKEASSKAIAEIEKEFEEYKKTQKKSYDESLNDLNKKVKTVREDAVKESTAKLTELEQTVNGKLESINMAIKTSRTDEEKLIDENAELYSKRYAKMLANEKNEVEERLSELNKSDEVAAYFKDKKWSKASAAAVLCVPIVPLGFVAFEWGKFVKNVVTKM